MERHHASGPVIAAMPLYNEEETIGTVVLQSLKHVDEVYCVDDGSFDSSARIASKLGAKVHYHRSNRGYGAALKSIFKYALESDAKALVILDSDGQHDPDDIPTLLEPIFEGEADFVIGSRFIEGGSGEEMPAYRKLGVKLITATSNLTTNLSVRDTQSGFRAFSNQALNKIRFDQDGMESTLEMLEQCNEMDLAVTEVPTVIRYDVPKGSRFTAMSHGFTVLSYALISLSQKKPFLAFGLPGAGLLTLGSAIGMRALNRFNDFTGASLDLTVGPGLTAAWLSMLGISLIFTGLVLQGTRTIMKRLIVRNFGIE
ncbi:MAG: glycosyltransferase family 2 protein [Candidatus Thalassarchaeaceae archaeon]|jgi:glycosyltransferase involved in cell wall biosynthesis|nr:glycosyltransferase family 2 protein [Candidatus Thalassarchaeaceae archaeon]